METKFRDKAHLATYSLDTRIFDAFGVTVSDAAPLRSVFLLTTDQGAVIFKKIDYPVEEITFIHTALEYVRKNYPQVVSFRRTRTGSPYLSFEGDTYVMLKLIEGRECMFDNPVDLKNATTALARYHQAAVRVECPIERRDLAHRMPGCFRDMTVRLSNFRSVAELHVNRTNFDQLYLQHCDAYERQAEKALALLESSQYHQLCSQKRTLCHHDLAHHNILMGEDGAVHFVDFDYAIVDHPCHDLSNLIRKAAKYNGWSKEAYLAMTGAYEEAGGFDRGDERVLCAYLMFPYDFYSISNLYYSRSKKWDEEEYLDKLTGKLAVAQEREEFLEWCYSRVGC